MALPKVQKGDVYQIQATNGVCYIQCVKETPITESEKIRVLPGVYSSADTVNLDSIINKKELFFSELPLKYALKRKLVLFVGNYPIPIGSEAPKFYRDHPLRPNVKGWRIVEADTLHGRFVETLSPEEQKLSPCGMISIPDIIERIENNWTPLDWK